MTAFAVLAFLIAASTASAVNTTANVTVNVNISTVGAIVVLPNWINWTAMSPGSDSAVSNFIIKNTGSVNVSDIFMNTSTIGDESTNPLQTADVSKYAAAGLVMVKNATDTSYYHAGRLEWNLSTVLTDEVLSLAAGVTNMGHGWYRNASGNEYLWKLENGSNGFCNTSSATFTIKTVPENQTTMNRNLGANTMTCAISDSGNAAWSSASCGTSGPLAGQCVATSSNCDKIMIYKYFGPLSDYPACANAAYLRKNVIVPGDEAAFSLKASVPKGIPAGDTKTGILTIFAGY